MQQTAQAPAPPQQPLPPPADAPAGAPVTVTITGANGTTTQLPVPMTRADVAALRARRSEISRQLSNVAERRSELAQEMAQQPPGPARTGMEARLAVMDTRLAELEADLASTGKQLSAAPQGLLTGQTPPQNSDMSPRETALGIVMTIFVLFPLVVVLGVKWIKRGKNVVQAASPETNERLERLEQGVDAIAIEIERISEGQRFVTKLLSEGVPANRLPENTTVAEKI